MSHASHPVHLREEGLMLGPLARRISTVGFGVAAVGILAGAGLSLLPADKAQTFWFSYLVAFVFWLTLSLGALVFVAIQHATRASWSVVVRRIAEVYSTNFILLAVLLLPLLFLGAPTLYNWINPAPENHHLNLITHKSPYLNYPFFIARMVLYFGVWIVLSRYFYSRSVQQDKSGDPQLTLRMWTTGGPAILVFALTSTFAAFDLVMTLQPEWFSTMFGVYFFAGSMLSFMAFLGGTALFLQGRGHLRHVITKEHYHDIGKLTFAFVFFWGYIAFSQFMLIWYANIPEETGWYAARQSGTWIYLEVGLLFGHFFIPFLGLIGRWAKRRLPVLAFWCVWVLIWHWLDMVYLIMPPYRPENVPNLLPAILLTIGFGGLYVAVAALQAAKNPIIPVRDPRLVESLAFDNIKV